MSSKLTNVQSTASGNLKTPADQTQIQLMNKLTPQRNQIAPLSNVKKQPQWGDVTTKDRITSPRNLNQPGSQVSNKVVMKPTEEWKLVQQEQSPRKREASAEPASKKTECASS